MDWLKRLFGYGRKELTLVERHFAASEIAKAAISTFDRIVEDLQKSAEDLKAVANEARTEAAALTARAADANAEAAKHEARATKIRSLTD